MIYKSFKDLKLSALGLGCMRLPTVNNDCNNIDEQKTAEMVDYAIKNGINYFDTAWIYHGGQSETVIGKILKNYPRESFYLASKFPGFDLANINKVEEIFEKQLEKCQVEYFDFYLFHNLCELNVEQYLDEKYRIYDYLMQQKRAGRIRHLGVSTHGTLETMKRFLDKYGKDMEFCQLQVNWLDWDFQNAKEKIELVTSYGIPVWVMEPVRGGSLCNLAPKYAQKLNSFAPDRTFAEWAFRFLQSVPEVTVTLSGMSNFEQLKENVEIFSQDKPLDESERALLFDIAYEMTHNNTLPCTACKYCTTKCPKELNIPWLIELYNEHTYSDGGFIAPMAMESLSDDKKPSACIGCGACERVCPQNLKISEMMKDFAGKIK